jgi:hypothetical protein
MPAGEAAGWLLAMHAAYLSGSVQTVCNRFAGLRALLPVHCELSLADSILDPVEAHVHGFGLLDFGSVVGKSISCRVIGGDAGWLGCSLSSSFRICHMWAASWPLWKRAPVSASEADDITFFMMRLSMWIGVLGRGLLAGSSLPPR